jgi:hypothetical protein
MGHFTIQLPNNLHGDVRCGTIRKKTLLLNLFKRSKPDVKRGYVVKIEPSSTTASEYRLLKTMDGKWLSESIGGFQVSQDDDMTASIRSAIDNYEGCWFS